MVDRSVTLAGNTVTVIGDVHLILKNGCTLTITGAGGAGGGSDGSGTDGSDGSGGISILNGSSLTIYGQTGQSGELKVTGGSGGKGGNGGGGVNGGNGGQGANAINGSITVYGGNVIASGGAGGEGGPGDRGGPGGNGGAAITGKVTIYGGSVTGTGGSGGRGGSSNGTGSGNGGSDGIAISGSVDCSDGYVHLTRAGRDEDTVEAMEWTGGPNSFPPETNWVKIQPLRVNSMTVTTAPAKINPGGTVNLTAKIVVLNPMGLDPLNVTKGVTWTVTGGKNYAVKDGKLTVRENETAKTLTVTAQFGSDTGSATVEIEHGASLDQLDGVVTIGDTIVALPGSRTATPNQDGTATVPGGSIVIPPAGPSITVSNAAAVDENGNITFSGAGSATVGGTTVTLPAGGGTITPNADNTVSVPSGSKITNRSGKKTTVPPQGGTINRDGIYEDNTKTIFEAPSTFPPTVPKPDNGAVSVSPSSPKKGDTVTITPTPDWNYEVGTVTVKDSPGGALEVKDNFDGTYSFTQPGEVVTVEVTFVSQAQAMPFFDVRPGDWYYDAVVYVNHKGIMGGYGGGFFQPDIQLSRAMLAQVLYNMAGGFPVSGQTGFHDVPAGAWYAEAVRWAAGEGIITGYSDGSFRPGAPITREQFAVMLYRFQQSRGGGSAGQHALDYTDAETIGAYAREAVVWCTANGILGGYGDNTLRPKGQTTRAQAAAMLTRFCKMN